jgi:hypothetical protein
MHFEAKHDVAAVTICSTNFMAKALALRESYLSYHPESDFYILIVDRKHDRFENLAPDIRVLWVEDLGIENFSHYAMKFDILELNTNVKAVLLAMLLAHYNAVLYLDPDIYFYGSLEPVFRELSSHAIVVTPHSLTPILDGKKPSDSEFIRFGTFNLGFVGVSKCDEAFRFLDWWSQRCLQRGFYEPQLGLSTDQKWIDLAPSFFAGLKILRDPGLNVAFWNLHERTISKRGGTWQVNGDFPLRFFHFSSFTTNSPHSIAGKQSRYEAESRPDLHELLDGYAAKVRENENEQYAGYHYSFNHFEDGMYVTPTLRRFYAALEEQFPTNEDPFSHGSAVQRFAIAHGLAGKKYKLSKALTFKEVGSYSRAARAGLIGLRYILRMIGPNRYFTLMRYLAYISSIRNQSDMFSARV